MVHAADLMEYEKRLMAEGCKLICGVDEVGRGPLAGPVTCAAVIMPLDDLIEGVNDSKKVAKKKRERLAEVIKEQGGGVFGGVLRQREDRRDEHPRRHQGVHGGGCRRSLAVTPDVVIVDALTLDIPVRTFGIVHGDAQSYSIAAASILAKVERDALHDGRWTSVYPGYGFSPQRGIRHGGAHRGAEGAGRRRPYTAAPSSGTSWTAMNKRVRRGRNRGAACGGISREVGGLHGCIEPQPQDARAWRVDIVAADGRTLVFVEVKSSDVCGGARPAEHVTDTWQM